MYKDRNEGLVRRSGPSTGVTFGDDEGGESHQRRTFTRPVAAGARMTPRRAVYFLFFLLVAGGVAYYFVAGSGPSKKAGIPIGLFDANVPADNSAAPAVSLCKANGQCVTFGVGQFDRNQLRNQGIEGVVKQLTVRPDVVVRLGTVQNDPAASMTFTEGSHECTNGGCSSVVWMQVAVLSEMNLVDAEEVVDLCYLDDGSCVVLPSCNLIKPRPKSQWSLNVPLGMSAMLLRGTTLVHFLSNGDHICRTDDATSPCYGVDLVRVTYMDNVLNSIAHHTALADIMDWPERALARPYKMVIPARQPFHSSVTTLVTQITVGRLDRLERIAASWDGPISVAIYLLNPWDIITATRYLLSEGRPDSLSHVTVTFVQPDYRLDYRLYPINQLRNDALSAAKSDYVFVIDADFVPSAGLLQAIQTVAVPEMQANPSEKLAFVIASPAVRRTASIARPSTIDELRQLFKEDTAYVTASVGHGPTRYDIFLDHPIGSAPRTSYEVCFQSQWEPYYVLPRDTPRYDERFRNQGGDKQSHALWLNAMGYRFKVLRDHFIYHLDHEPGMVYAVPFGARPIWHSHSARIDGREETSARAQSSICTTTFQTFRQRWPASTILSTTAAQSARQTSRGPTTSSKSLLFLRVCCQSRSKISNKPLANESVLSHQSANHYVS